MNTPFLKYGRLLLRQHDLDLKARALRRQVETILPKGFYSCVSYSSNGLTVSIKLADYLALNPDAKPTVWVHEKSEFNPETYARLEYPPFSVGELAPGKWMWVNATSEKFTPPVLTVPAVPAAAELQPA